MFLFMKGGFMGKIFGISDNPVSTIHSALNGTQFEPITHYYIRKVQFPDVKVDTFVSKEAKPVSNPFVKMRNGFGKLMAHFQHPQTK